MATDRLLLSQARQDGTASRACLSGAGQCDLLSHKDRLPVAQSAGALCPVGNGLSLFPIVEAQWALGGDSDSLSRTSARGGGTKSPPQCGDHRQPARPKHGVQQRGRLRRGQEDQRTQAPHLGGHDWPAAVGDSVARQSPGPRWRSTIVGQLLQSVSVDAPPRKTYLGRWRLRGHTGRVDPETVALHPGNREAQRTPYVQGAAAPLGSGTNLWLARALPPAQPGLRTTSQDRRDHGLFGHDSSHARTSRKAVIEFSNRLLGKCWSCLRGIRALATQRLTPRTNLPLPDL